MGVQLNHVMLLQNLLSGFDKLLASIKSDPNAMPHDFEVMKTRFKVKRVSLERHNVWKELIEGIIIRFGGTLLMRSRRFVDEQSR
jgi:hypothetical protein